MCLDAYKAFLNWKYNTSIISMLSNNSSWFEIEQESLEMCSERLRGEWENEVKEQKKDYKKKMFAIFLFIWSAVSGSLMVLQ